MTVTEHDTEDRIYTAITEHDTQALWRFDGPTLWREPASAAQPHRWRYADIRADLLACGDLITAAEAERRVLMLLNPGIAGRMATTATLYVGMQLLLPGENAPAHRHSPSAFRFVTEGQGAYTTVDGERLDMHPHDLILTPNWTWHDHNHDGDEPVIWFDGLDIAIVQMLEPMFYEQGPRRQALTVPENASMRQYLHGRLSPVNAGLVPTAPPCASPLHRYPWQETQRALDAIADDAKGSAYDGALLEYTHPGTGGPVMPSMSCRIQRLRPGFHGLAHRHTSSVVYQVVRGEGTTIIDGREFGWSPGDVIAVPSWARHEHHNSSPAKDAVLFSFTDEPLLTYLGLLRCE